MLNRNFMQSVSLAGIVGALTAAMRNTGDIAADGAEIIRRPRRISRGGSMARDWRNHCNGKYIPGGPRCNVKGTFIRNPKVAAQVNAMHDAWSQARTARAIVASAEAEYAAG